MSKRAVVKAIASGRLKASATVGGHYRIAVRTAREFLAGRGLDPSVLEIRTNQAVVLSRDRFVCNLLAGALNRAGMDVHVAEDLFAAGALCSEYRPVLVLVDTILAGPDPAVVFRHIRAVDFCRAARLVAMIFRDENVAARCRAAGADAVLGKPISMAEVTALLTAFRLGPGRR